MAQSVSDKLITAGIPYPAAIEIARQIAAGAPNATRGPMHHAGIGVQQAAELVAQINAGAFDSAKLARACWNPETARILKAVSGL